MRRGLTLDPGEVRLAAWLVGQAVDYLSRRDGALPAGAFRLRDDLAAEAGREVVATVVPQPVPRGTDPSHVSGRRGTDNAAAAVVVRDCPHAEMDAGQAARALGISERWVRRLAGDGLLIARKDAGRWLIDAASVAARKGTG